MATVGGEPFDAPAPAPEAAAEEETAAAREERLQALTASSAAAAAQAGGGGAEQLPAAEALKGEGNQLFKAGEYSTAVQAYQVAISLFSAQAVLVPEVKTLVVTLSSNAAEALLRLGMYQDAKDHAESALKLDAQHAKSQVRQRRAAMAVDMAASGAGAVASGAVTKEELARAVSAMVTLRREDASMPERSLCTSVNGRQDDRLFEVMGMLTPSVYQVIADIVKEELRELPGRLKARKIQEAFEFKLPSFRCQGARWFLHCELCCFVLPRQAWDSISSTQKHVGVCLMNRKQGCLTSALLSTNLRAIEGRHMQYINALMHIITSSS